MEQFFVNAQTGADWLLRDFISKGSLWTSIGKMSEFWTFIGRSFPCGSATQSKLNLKALENCKQVVFNFCGFEDCTFKKDVSG